MMNWEKTDGIPALSSQIKSQSARKPQGLTEPMGHLLARVTYTWCFLWQPRNLHVGAGILSSWCGYLEFRNASVIFRHAFCCLLLFSQPAEEMAVTPSLSSEGLLGIAQALQRRLSSSRHPILPLGLCWLLTK